MTGIFLLIVVGLWLWFSIYITRELLDRVPSRPWRWVVGLAAFVALLAAPVADEIVGVFQFRALCNRNAVFRIGVDKPEGRLVREMIRPANEVMPHTAITIYHTHVEYTDVRSGESVVKFDSYFAKGGVFIRTLGISENNSPITMGSDLCSPEQARGEAVPRTLKFTIVN